MAFFDFSSLLSSETFKKAAFGKVTQMMKENKINAVLLELDETENLKITPCKEGQIIVNAEEYQYLLKYYGDNLHNNLNK